MAKHGLGQGIDALFLDEAALRADTTVEQVENIAINDIVPNAFQPRKVFAEDKLQELAASIKTYGVLQPVVLRKKADGYELVAGERRWRASLAAGLKLMPAVVRSYSDVEMMEIALIENLQRQDLNVIEEGQAFRQLIEEFGFTQEELAEKIGRSRSAIANTMRLLQLPAVIQDYVSRGTLTMGQVRPLLGLAEQRLQLAAVQQIIDKELTAREAEALVKRLQAADNPELQAASAKPDIFLTEAEERLKLFLGTQVRIKPGKNKSRIEIEFYSPEDLERILEVMKTARAGCVVSGKNKNLTV